MPMCSDDVGDLTLELQATVRARAFDERCGGSARRAGQVLAGHVERDRREPFALEVLAPVTVYQLAEPG